MASLRHMQLSDLDDIAQLEKAIFQASAWKKEDIEKDLTDNPFSSYMVVCEDGKVVGYCGLFAMYENGEVISIGVHPDYQGRGLGKLLFEDMLKRAKRHEVETMSLEVRVSNSRAIALYESFGFKNVALRKQYYQDGEDAYLMVKEMGE